MSSIGVLTPDARTLRDPRWSDVEGALDAEDGTRAWDLEWARG
jgi:hypothetical protein